MFHASFQARARGAAILIEKNIQFEPSSVARDRNGYIIVSGKLFNRNVVLANVCAPNSDDAAFLERFFYLLPDLNSHALILGGDLNCWLDPELDRSSPRLAAVSKSAKYSPSYPNAVSQMCGAFYIPNTKNSHTSQTFNTLTGTSRKICISSKSCFIWAI